MNNYVTLFDSNYFSRGMMLLESLNNVSECGFTLYILAMDERVFNFFINYNSPSVVCFNVDSIYEMYPVLRKLKTERTRAEFCWTLASFSIQYVIRKYELESCTYLDSDICFYNDPKLIFSKLGDRSVIITEHNYSKEYDLSEIYGKYCVQFMYFKNNKDGNDVLEWWRKKCEEWCYSRIEDGKFGDQKYLDDWEARFKDIVYNCQDIGCGLAPWNCQKYDLINENGTWYIVDRIKKIREQVIFYHFHDLYKLKGQRWSLSKYQLTNSVLELYYMYIKGLKRIEAENPEFISKPIDIKDISEKLKIIKSIYRGIKSSFYWYNSFMLPKRNVVNDIEINNS